VSLAGNTVAADADQAGQGYAKAVDLVRRQSPGLVMVAAVVRSPRVEYQLKCDDPFLLKSRLDRIRQIVDAAVEFEVTSSRTARLVLTPKNPDKPLVVGIALARGRQVDVPIEHLRKSLADDLTKTSNHQYLLMDKAPVILTADVAPVSATESPEVVEAQYRQAIALAGNWPRAAVRVIPPASQPATRPPEYQGSISVPATRPSQTEASPTTAPTAAQPTSSEPAPTPATPASQPAATEPSPTTAPTGAQPTPPEPSPTTAPAASQPAATEPAAPTTGLTTPSEHRSSAN
jgi:hypothetical protein